MKKFFSTILVTALMLSVFADGENNRSKNFKGDTEVTVLSGTVVDQSTGETLPGAQVKISGLDQTVYTDLDGNFEVQGISPGNYNLQVSLVSYEENKIKNLVVSANKKSALKVELKR
jgi:protocatechuate 3,4-dioxygenase beta subunit